ncbi:hypothetical protein [Variovorax sp. Root411]|uniref:hypothetical protein n=1 Tax=Variovorax sp. Root411 TaxID=1736530 RepID=UPI001F1D4B9E|nr:hypothetical protein [Variovorax sp. Root411]
MTDPVSFLQAIPARPARPLFPAAAQYPYPLQALGAYASEWRASNKEKEELKWRIPPSGG